MTLGQGAGGHGADAGKAGGPAAPTAGASVVLGSLVSTDRSAKSCFFVAETSMYLLDQKFSGGEVEIGVESGGGEGDWDGVDGS